MTRHLITGGAGFVGSALAHRLVNEGHAVTVFDKFSRGKAERLPTKALQIKGDIRDSEAVARAVKAADVIWHLAYIQGTQTFYAQPKLVIEVALKGICNVLDAVSKNQDLILVSSSEAYQIPPEGMFPTDETVPLSVPDVTNPRYSYGGGKIASEIATLAYSESLNRAIIVRPHNIYGPDMGFEHVIPEFAVRMMELMNVGGRDFHIQGTGKETRSFCYIDDCVDGLMVAYERGEDRNVYHLGNPAEEYTILELVHQMYDWFGIDEMRIVPGELPKGSPTRRKPSIAKLAMLGYFPKVSLRAGLDPTLDWYKWDQIAKVAV